MADASFASVLYLVNVDDLFDAGLVANEAPFGAGIVNRGAYIDNWDYVNDVPMDPYIQLSSGDGGPFGGTLPSGPLTSAFSIEGKMILGDVTTKQYLYFHNQSGGTGLYVYVEGGLLKVANDPHGLIASVAVAVDTEFEWGVFRENTAGSPLRCFKDGVQFGATYNDSAFYNSGSFMLGADDTLGTAVQTGKCFRFRLTNGVTRHTANYTPETHWDDWLVTVDGALLDETGAAADGTARTWSTYLYNRATMTLWDTQNVDASGNWSLKAKTQAECVLYFQHASASSDPEVFNDMVLRVIPPPP